MLNFIRENKRLILTLIALILGAIMLATCCGEDGGGQYRMF